MGLVFVNRFDLRIGSFSSVSISVLELKLLAKSSSEFSRLSSNELGCGLSSVNTLPFSSRIKTSWSALLASSMTRSTSVSVMFVVTIVSGPMLFPCVGSLSGLVCGEFGLVRSLINLGLPLPIEPNFVTVVFGDSGVFGFTRSINGASESSSELITIARLFGWWSDKPAVWSAWSSSSVVGLLVKCFNRFTNQFSVYYSSIRCTYGMVCARYR